MSDYYDEKIKRLGECLGTLKHILDCNKMYNLPEFLIKRIEEIIEIEGVTENEK